MSIREFASKINVSNDKLRMWLAGARSLSVVTREKVSKAIGISMRDLIAPGARKRVRAIINGMTSSNKMTDDQRFAAAIARGEFSVNMKERVDSLIWSRYKVVSGYNGAGDKAKADKRWMRRCQVCGDVTGNGFLCSACRGDVKFGVSAYNTMRRAI